MTEMLSPHFALAELTVSATAARLGLDNTPSPRMVDELARTAARLENVRAILGHKPVIVLSGFRSAEVNKAVGGSATSAHMKGMAVDFICPGFGSPRQVALRLAQALRDYDQLILEHDQWVHVGFGPGRRHQVLTATRRGGKTVYQAGIV